MADDASASPKISALTEQKWRRGGDWHRCADSQAKSPASASPTHCVMLKAKVEDQSRWGDTVHEHFKENSNPMTRSIPRPREGSGMWNCTNCACGKFWTKNLGRSRAKCSAFDQDGSASTSSLSWLKGCAKPKNGDKLFVISMDVASAFDAVRAEILCDALLERGASFSAAAMVRENLNLRCGPWLGHTQCAAVNLEVGSRQGGPRTPSEWNQLVATLVDELVRQWADRNPAVE